MKQVFAEHAVFDAFFQVLVCRSNHAHIGFDGVMTTDAVVSAVAQHTQQTGLQVKGHVADFIEEQRAALGLFKAATAHGLRAREGTTFVPEELALQQIFGNGSRVDGNKRAFVARVATGRVFVQSTRHQFFARATLAGDHHGHIALAQTANGAKHILHGGRLAQHFGRGILRFGLGLLALAFTQSPTNQLHRFGQIKRLGQVLKRASLKGRHRTVQIRKRRHDDDGQRWQTLFDLGEQIESRAARHADVADQNLRAVLFAHRVERLQHFAWTGEAARGQVLAQQRFFKHEANGLVVVHNPNRFHLGTFCSMLGATRSVKAAG